jgi:glycosyltransferase involved in cell wall biosynthesis
MATAVIIPARNEEDTIGQIVRAFQRNSQTMGHVYVGIDSHTTDNTEAKARDAGALVVNCNNIHGKGEVVAFLAGAMRLLDVMTERVILCDADYTGLNRRHVGALLSERRGMAIGVPDFPTAEEVPAHVSRAWPLVSGFRLLPQRLIPDNAHGYLLETQLNQAAQREGEIIRTIPMPGLTSPFRWPLSPRRMAALRQDADWGFKNGVLK